ncbi:MAG: prepilin-type N-terminal cleavage/methylation domain-containing protein [Gammaproteobacteria bacterium]|jgi:MSHA pilin protein MshA
MKKSQSGFTLIELVVVIVLLGILGVTALGKFENLSADAADATEKGIAGELSSASSLNYAANLVNGGGTQIATVSCAVSDLGSLMQTGSVPTDNLTYAFGVGNPNTLTDAANCASGQSFTCTITDDRGDNSSNGVASIICTG